MDTKLLRIGAVVITCGLALGTIVFAHDVQWQNISTEELAAKLDRAEELLLVNVLPKIIHDARHIPGSISIPLGLLAASTALPDNRDTPLIFYCMGTM